MYALRPRIAGPFFWGQGSGKRIKPRTPNPAGEWGRYKFKFTLGEIPGNAGRVLRLVVYLQAVGNLKAPARFQGNRVDGHAAQGLIHLRHLSVDPAPGMDGDEPQLKGLVRKQVDNRFVF